MEYHDKLFIKRYIDYTANRAEQLPNVKKRGSRTGPMLRDLFNRYYIVLRRRVRKRKNTLMPMASNDGTTGGRSLPDNASLAMLVASLFHRKLTVRAEAAHRLGELGESDAIGPLLEALCDKQRFVRAEAARALGKLGERVPTIPLIKALKDKDGSVRVAAVQTLGMLGRRKALEDLTEALHDDWPPVREAAVLAFAKLGEQIPAKTLQTLSQDKDQFVRAAVVFMLATQQEHTSTKTPDPSETQKLLREAAMPELVSLRAGINKGALSESELCSFGQRTAERNKQKSVKMLGWPLLWQSTQFPCIPALVWLKQYPLIFVLVGTIFSVLFLFSRRSRPWLSHERS